jgi:tetratricopeptide (TPR) repeat protein
VVGSFHVRTDSLRVEARVLDVSDDKAINVIPHQTGPLAAPSVAIGMIRSRIMGSLVARADPTIGQDVRSHAPTYEAYREYESGMKYFGVSSQTALSHFERALELDPGFTYVEYFRVAALANLDRFAEADSLVQVLRSSARTVSPHLGLYLDVFDARLHGELEEALRGMREVVRIAPSHYMSRRFLAIVALRLNRPSEAIANLKQLQADQPETDLYMESWTDGGLSNAYHMLREYERELQILDEAVERFPDMLWLRARQARALAALGRIADIERLIEETSASPAGHGSIGYILRIATGELRAHGHPEDAAVFAERALHWYRTNLESEGASESSKNLLGHALYAARRWGEARELFGELASEHPDNIDYAGCLGTLAARAGDVERADAVRESLLSIDEPYDFGMNTYWAACISAQLGRKDEAMELLRRSYAEGAGLGLHVHQDQDLEPLWDYPPFQRFIAPRG